MSLNSVSPLVDACPTGTRLRYKSLAVLLLLHIFVIGICVFKAFDISWKTHTNPPITGLMVRWAFAFARCLGLCYTIGANYELFHKRFMISYLKLSEKLFFTNLNVNDSIGIISRTYHKCWTVVTCEKLWPQWIIISPKNMPFHRIWTEARKLLLKSDSVVLSSSWLLWNSMGVPSISLLLGMVKLWVGGLRPTECQ